MSSSSEAENAPAQAAQGEGAPPGAPTAPAAPPPPPAPTFTKLKMPPEKFLQVRRAAQ
ncbi:unnamed protein product, partial [Amoebophrya sp. A25]|eukprot:GSA25T00006942001.1